MPALSFQSLTAASAKGSSASALAPGVPVLLILHLKTSRGDVHDHLHINWSEEAKD